MTEVTSAIDAKALIKAAEKMREAVTQARLAYQFCPGSYATTALQACLAAAKAFDKHVNELAHRHSAEWLRKFPRIIEDSDAE